MNVPVLDDPVGDPVGVRVAVRRLLVAAESIGVVGRGLSDLNQQAVQAWESQAQRLFSLMADGFSQVVTGSAGVTSEFSSALDRYATTLEVCQGEVRVCRQRLNDLVASTPVGMVPDPVAVNSIVGQANQAYDRAGQAARELSDKAMGLIGGPSVHGQTPVAGDAHASFVSQAHNGGLASTHPAAAGFDVQAAQIQTQMNGVMGSLTGLVNAETRPASNLGLYPSSAIIGGNNFSSSITGPAFLSGPAIVGGNYWGDGITKPDLPSGPAIVGGTFWGDGMSGNPQMALIQAGENISRNNAIKVWQSAMPGVPVPSGSAGDILSQLLREADSLTPTELAAVGIIQDSISYGIRTQLLPPGWELVRETSYF